MPIIEHTFHISIPNSPKREKAVCEDNFKNPFPIDGGRLKPVLNEAEAMEVMDKILPILYILLVFHEE